ncbi:BTAD domain-containing putative transcriptional regulator [Pseudonocardia humida]|uniref:Winged helix-turn-helix domain-containing protein n=1 Tax=Pseudonocardia humida TaxID=2800819 RepID=A0ABT0ZSQ2_9PSEU|nr:BTAD domain-containing putative transcriptional regulator [Pseudonocardia humida]MCO1653746.1 winged helix-turn-helix domain-containing protein [Pseudonocardia humida]
MTRPAADPVTGPAVTAPGSVSVSVLGPLTATVDGRPVDLRGPRQRAVLAALVLAGPRVVTVDRLLADVWGDAAPGVGTLHYYVSQIRHALEPSRARGEPPAVVVRQGPGYALRLPDEAVDARRFARLAAEGAQALADGRPRAVELLEAALGLWRGPAYADVADAGFLAPELTRLGELRLAAAEDLIDARLRAGDTAVAVATAREHTARHPLRERGWELLVLALSRAGRQAEALAAVATVRRLLAEELGLDPGPGLLRVEAAVRAQETAPPAPAPRAPAPSAAIPVPLTAMVGRDELLAEVVADLGDHRLVTLTGPGGVGKTRLALEVAARLGPATDAVLVELAVLDDPALLTTTLAAALGLSAAEPAALAGLLGGRAVLVLLDNCEHLVGAVAGLLADLLARCPGLRVLATSRATLELPGELVREVPPLDPAGAATRLFVQRARSAAPGWRPDAAELAAVARVCAQLDGLPLAVELAATRMRVLSAEELAAAIDRSRLALPSDGQGGAPAHQRGMERTADWSYSSLDEPQRRMFRRLAVFAGPFDLAAAAALAEPGTARPDDPFDDAVPLVAGLVRRSLLATVPGAGPRRFRMLRTLREFALLRAGAGERAATEAAHRRFVLRAAVAAEREIRGPAAAATMAGLRRDRAEHRAALGSALAAGDASAAAGLCAALSWFWYRDGAIGEGLRFAAAALDLPGAVEDGLRAQVLHGTGGLRYLAADAAGAARALRTATELAAAAGEAVLTAHSAAWLAHMRTFLDPAAEALAAAEAAAEAAAGTEPWVHAEALMIAGMARRRTGAAPARPVLARAVDVAEAAGHGWAVVSSTWALMKAAVDDGDLDAALAAAARMRGPLSADGDVTSWLVLVHTTAGVLAGTGRAAEAATLMGAVDALGERVGFHPGRMDPVDGPREAEAVRAALDPADLARHLARGRDLGRAEVDALLGELLG